MQIINSIESSKVTTALDTYRHVTTAAQMYTVQVAVSEIPPSGMSIVIQQNGVTKATSTATTTAQTHIDLRVVMNCAASDNIDIILSSSSAVEAGPNQIKAILNIHPGSN